MNICIYVCIVLSPSADLVLGVAVVALEAAHKVCIDQYIYIYIYIYICIYIHAEGEAVE